MTTSLGDTALVLVGHGSARNADSRIPTERLAAAVRARGLFAAVHAAFWKEAPFAAAILDQVQAAEVVVVPNFAGEGIFTSRLIPDAMGLTGPLTRRGDRRILYAAPVGSHPRIPELLLRRVDALAGDADRAAICLLVIGHGSRRPGGSSVTVEATAQWLRATGRFGEVCTAYLEQDPPVADWPALTALPRVIAAPMLVAEGLHGSEDLPPLFGLAKGETGPSTSHGREVWLCRGIGSDPDIVEVILDRVAEIRSVASAS